MRGLTCKLSMLLVAVALLLPAIASAQVLTGVQNVSLNATLGESLSITLTGATSVSFNLVTAGVASGSAPVAVQTSWVLQPSRTAVKLVGYFDSTSALTNAGPPAASIDVANVFGQVTTGSPTIFTAFTQTVAGIGTAGASLELFSETITGVNKNKTRTDSLNLQIDLTSTPQQPAGDYTGTLRIRAIAL